ncbi:Vitamin B12-binding protein [bacterium HR36]|nr:Vitamin B12-binding protein [bacterium HR36]
MLRIVSLLASATETVYALDMGQFLVGRSHECDYPPEVQHLPVLTKPRIEVDRSSREIDEQVRTLWHRGEPVYWIDEELLRQLRPTVILTQDHCEVCAVSLADVERALASWRSAASCEPATLLGQSPPWRDPPRIVALKPHSLLDVWKGIEAIGEALGVAHRAQRLVADLHNRLVQLSQHVPQRRPAPTVLCLEWLDPVMSAGNWMPELVSWAGGIPVLDYPGQPSRYLSWNDVLVANPQVIVITCCGWEVSRSRAELGCLERLPGWWDLQAVRSRRVYVADGNHYFNRPGPRLVESAYILAEMLHPEELEPAHCATAWQPAYL